MASLVNSFLNQVRAPEAFDSPETREEMIRKTEIVKVASVVAIVVCAIFLMACPYLATLCILLPIAYACYEIGTVAGNYQEIFEDWKTAIKVNLSDRQYVNHLTKRAPLARSIARIAKPL